MNEVGYGQLLNPNWSLKLLLMRGEKSSIKIFVIF